jgi:hypothetical protein
VVDGSGLLGVAIFGSPDTYFDGRKYSYLGRGDIQKLSDGLLFSKGSLVLGGAKEKGDRKLSGFRYESTGLLGLALGDESAYTALAAGLSVNGDAPGVVPIALTLPVEISHTRSLGSYFRASLWIRGDTFLAARQTRREAADGQITDEFLVGGWLSMAFEKESRKDKGKKKIIGGYSLGMSYHRTMGSGVVILLAGFGANVTPRQ